MKTLELQPTIENLIDTYKNDTIGRNVFLHRFVKLLDSLEDSCVIAIDNQWGGGKTFFVKQAKLILDSANEFTKILWDRFPAFLDKNLPVNPAKCEYFLPFVVNEQLEDGTASVQVLPCEETWYGVTYREDLESVQNAIAKMKEEKIYEEVLWK